MRVFRHPPQRPRPSFQARQLRLFSKPRHEVIIANNSGLFFTLASLKMHGMHAHPHLRVIAAPFWLDISHTDYDDLNWGQTPRGLPWYARHEFQEIYPRHSENEFIKWG
jgi:hypothetical protein